MEKKKSIKASVSSTSMSFKDLCYINSGSQENTMWRMFFLMYFDAVLMWIFHLFCVLACVDVTLIVLSEDPEKSRSPVE